MTTPSRNRVGTVEAELERESELIAERFPEVPRAAIDDAVHEVYDLLETTATVRSHLFTITGSLVMARLRTEGATFRPPKAGPDGQRG
jgi:hypothetical protein